MVPVPAPSTETYSIEMAPGLGWADLVHTLGLNKSFSNAWVNHDPPVDYRVVRLAHDRTTLVLRFEWADQAHKSPAGWLPGEAFGMMRRMLVVAPEHC